MINTFLQPKLHEELFYDFIFFLMTALFSVFFYTGAHASTGTRNSNEKVMWK